MCAPINRRSFITLTGAGLASGAAIANGVPAAMAEGEGDLSAYHVKQGATERTAEANEAVYDLLDFDDRTEFECATRGLIKAPDALEIFREDGALAWSQKAYTFLDDDAPATANPSLWRDAQLNHIHGLFEVIPGIYQVRGYDMTNITFIKGDTGWIVMDPLMTVECARAAFDLVKSELGDFPVKCVISSHPHVDHYAGIKGIVTEEQITSGEVPYIVPDGFEEHAVEENVYAGVAMARRASYQYGTLVEPAPDGSLVIGIGMGQSTGTLSYISPTDVIRETGETRTVDGLTLEFHMTPGTEAPCEMNMWIPQLKALWMAENCTGTLHNLYTLRGAQVRDGNAWAFYIMEALKRYGDEVEVVFQSHNWPHWGNGAIKDYMRDTAAMYKFINDQSLMYVNQGYTSTEIAHMITLPADLEKNWYTRQYYGTVAHDAKAVYQKYMGWYDANPIHLGELTPSDRAVKLVEYMGGRDAVLGKAAADYEDGQYQWVAEVTNALVFADPGDTDARSLCASALEQLGYQAESGTWRNAYLCAAHELREGTGDSDEGLPQGSSDLMNHMTTQMILDYLGIRFDCNKAADLNFVAGIDLTDTGEQAILECRSGVLLYCLDASADAPDVTLTTTRRGLMTLFSADPALRAKAMATEGDASIIEKIADNVVSFPGVFNIVEP